MCEADFLCCGREQSLRSYQLVLIIIIGDHVDRDSLIPEFFGEHSACEQEYKGSFDFENFFANNLTMSCDTIFIDSVENLPGCIKNITNNATRM